MVVVVVVLVLVMVVVDVVSVVVVVVAVMVVLLLFHLKELRMVFRCIALLFFQAPEDEDDFFCSETSETLR